MAGNIWTGLSDIAETLGTAFRAKEYGLGETLMAIGTGKVNAQEPAYAKFTGLTPQSQAAGFRPAIESPRSYAGPETMQQAQQRQYYSTDQSRQAIQQGQTPLPTQRQVQNPSANRAADVAGTAGRNVGDIISQNGRNYRVVDPANGVIEPVWDQSWQDVIQQQRAAAEAQRQQQEQLLSEQLDAAYRPAYSNLDAVEAQYKQEYPTAQQFIEQSYGEITPQLESEQKTRLAGIQAQRESGMTEKKSQIAKAQQLYNELRQSGLTRFGGASSTGEAYGELLGRTTAQQMGQTEQQFGQYFRQLDQEETNINDFYAKQKTNLEKDKQLKLQQLKNDFDAQIRQINTQRTTLDSEKAARRLAALQEYSAQARQMQYENATFQRNLDLWRQSKDEAIATARQFQAKSFTVPGMPGVLGGFSITTAPQQTQTPTGYLDDETLKRLQAQGLNLTGGTFVPGKGVTSYRLGSNKDEDVTF